MTGWLQRILVVVCVVFAIARQNADFDRDPQLKILREMMPCWDRTEFGGIVLLVKPPREQDQVVYRMLVGSPTDGSNDARLGEKWHAALASLTDKLASSPSKCQPSTGGLTRFLTLNTR
jgi:hypothetical protein